MKKKNLEFVSNLVIETLYYKIIFENRDLFRNENLTYYESLLKRYISYDLNHETQLCSNNNKSHLELTFLDEIIMDKLENEGFFIDTKKISTLLLQVFETNVAIDIELFSCIKRDLKGFKLTYKEEQEYETILNKIQDYALSKNWREDFNTELINNQNILKVICNPSVYIVKVLVNLWVNALVDL
jgi:hypothetical protein